MGQVMSQPTLQRLRETLAAIDPKLGPALPGEDQQVELAAPIDAVLGGGLACGALHELAPAAPFQLGATSGFAAAVAARAGAGNRGGEVLWITTDFARREGGGPYGPGLDLFGLSSARLAGPDRLPADRCPLGDGGRAALPRARLRHRRADRRGRRGRPHRHPQAFARRARGRQRPRLGPWPPDPPSCHPDAERGGHALARGRRREPARSPGAIERRPRPPALRSFALQEPPRSVRPLAR